MYYLMLWFVLVGMVVTLGAIVWLAVWIIDEFFTWFEEGTPMSVFDSNGTNPKPWDSTPAVFENGTSRRVITPELVDPEPITAPDSWSGRRRDWKREAHKSEIAHQRTNQLQERRQQQTILGEMVLFKDYVSTTLVQNQALRERELMQLEREREQRQEEAVRHHYAMEELYHLAPVRLQQKREAEAAQHREHVARSERVVAEEKERYLAAERKSEEHVHFIAALKKGIVEVVEEAKAHEEVARRIANTVQEQQRAEEHRHHIAALNKGSIEKILDAKTEEEVARHKSNAALERERINEGKPKPVEPELVDESEQAQIKAEKKLLDRDLREYRKLGIDQNHEKWKLRVKRFWERVDEITEGNLKERLQ